MIRLALTDALRKRDRTLYWLAKETRTDYKTLHRMATADMRKVDLSVLERICRALECEPGELLRMEKD